jgi:hypothetical protein
MAGAKCQRRKGPVAGALGFMTVSARCFLAEAAALLIGRVPIFMKRH